MNNGRQKAFIKKGSKRWFKISHYNICKRITRKFGIRKKYSAKQLESLGLCIRKLDLVETIYSSYGKYLWEFQKRTNSDFENKISKYKFHSGDVVGLFQYGDKIH